MTESSNTLSQVIDRLKTQGYTEDLNRPENNTLWLDPDAVPRLQNPESI